jgi:hypothetical protein
VGHAARGYPGLFQLVDELPGAGVNAAGQVIGPNGSPVSGGGGSTTVEDVLTSTSTANALSAAQGKVLKDAADAHVAAADPHPQYTTAAELASAIAAGGTSSTVAPSQVVIPVFRTLGGLDNLGAAIGTALALHASGGLISSVSGTAASGYLGLPREPSAHRVSRTDFLLDWDTAEAGATVRFGLGAVGDGYTVQIANSGGNVVVTHYDRAGATVTHSGPLTSRASLSVSLAVANGIMTTSVHLLDTSQTLEDTNPWLGPALAWRHTNAQMRPHAYVQTNAISSRIIGYLHNPDSIDGDATGALLTRTAVMHAASAAWNSSGMSTPPYMDTESIIVMPERASLSTALKCMWFFHARTGYMTDALVYPAPALSGGRAAWDATRSLLAAGYAYVAIQGGPGVNNAHSDWWGNSNGLEKCRNLLDWLRSNVSNVGKAYLVGWSMGGVCAANFAKMQRGAVSAAYLITPVTDLEDSVPTYGVQISAGLKPSLDAAYARYWISQANTNLGNTPSADTTATWWRPVSAPGGMPDAAWRSGAVTTTSAATTSGAYADVSSAAVIQPGDYVCMQVSGIVKRVAYKALGLPNRLQFDGPITCKSGERVALLQYGPGTSRPSSYGSDYYWVDGYMRTYSGGGTFGLGDIVRANTATPALDVKPYNPIRTPEAFSPDMYWRIGVAGDGTQAGNDGILGNDMMYRFRDAINAVYPGRASIYAGSGAHVQGGFTAADMISFFAAR